MRDEKAIMRGVSLAMAAAVAAAVSCGGGGGGGSSSSNLSSDVCSPSSGPFSLSVTNPFFPLPVGQVLTFEGSEDGELVEIIITVLDETELVAGVTTRVVEERESIEGDLVEVSRNFFAQAPDGTVCYFGEDVDIFENGDVASHDGQWRAGVNGAQPGIIMPANPKVGDTYKQEDAPGIAEDRAQVTALDAPLTVPAGTFTDTVTTLEDSTLEPGTGTKVYAAGVGLAQDNAVVLISID